MESEAQSHDRDGQATTGRFALGVFIAAELLCTGVLVAWAVL